MDNLKEKEGSDDATEGSQTRSTCASPSMSSNGRLSPKPCSSVSDNDDKDMVRLSCDFVPANMDVVVGTGREAKVHSGNDNFMHLLKDEFLDRYSKAKSKLDKTVIISEIVNAVRDKSPTRAGFVKKIDERWHRVDDHLAREKVSQSLRNLLHNQYRSSVKSKKQRRCIIRQEIDDSVGIILNSNQSFLSRRINELSVQMEKKGGAKAPEADVLQLFSQANIDILEGLKNDLEVRRRVQLSSQGPSLQQASADSTAM